MLADQSAISIAKSETGQERMNRGGWPRLGLLAGQDGRQAANRSEKHLMALQALPTATDAITASDLERAPPKRSLRALRSYGQIGRAC
jgi:hypothetical protein